MYIYMQGKLNYQYQNNRKSYTIHIPSERGYICVYIHTERYTGMKGHTCWARAISDTGQGVRTSRAAIWCSLARARAESIENNISR